MKILSLLFAALTFFAINAVAQTTTTSKEKKNHKEASVTSQITTDSAIKYPNYGKTTDFRRVRITISNVDKKLKEISSALTNEKDNFIPSIEFSTYSSNIEIFCKAPNIEVETLIPVKWFESLYALIKSMYDIRVKMEIALLNNDKKAFSEATNLYLPLFEKYKELTKKQPKLSPEQLKDAKKKLDALDKLLAEEDKAKEKSAADVVEKGKKKAK